MQAQTPVLSIRTNTSNPDHHLWNNNGTWWCHYTRCPTPFTAERVRQSLGTRSLTEARKRRDQILECGGLTPLCNVPPKGRGKRCASAKRCEDGSSLPAGRRDVGPYLSESGVKPPHSTRQINKKL